MTSAVTDPRPASVEDLLEPALPSALARRDAALAARGVDARAIAETKSTFAAIGGALAPDAPPGGFKSRLLATVGRKGRYGVFADRIARLFDLSIDDAIALLAKLEDPAAWIPFLVPGVEMVPVAAGPRCAGAIATIARFAPGATFPEHAHRGDETMVVLDGGFRESGDGACRGEEAWRGDEIHRSDGTAHALVGLDGVPCIVAALIDGHADFR
jgi:hypothetical protein